VVVAVIPSRYASTRLPGKPLLDIGGQSLVQRVYGAVSRCSAIDRTIVATDDDRIVSHVASFGGEAVLTSATHESGTDRVAEVTATLPADALVINVQGDEPFLEPDLLDQLLTPLQSGQSDIATLATPIADEGSLFSPHVVKVVTGERQRAIYFSRHAIPYLRELPLGRWLERGVHRQHLGVYAFRNATLQQLTRLTVGSLERLERLEQLRWLQAGHTIHVVDCHSQGYGIDTPTDLERARAQVQTLP
jgi:3-deoxy-manno-octulosonate cytidylyltransferase (CMP-KDO synthetase)